ncbi:glycosyltransferase family 4 protein, partial [bacterium]|nr:glycosyltransferase family 4 protein [bacterium]
LSAMEHLWGERNFKGSLVLAGQRGWACEELLARCDDLSTRWPLRMMGYIPDDSVPSLIMGARIAVVPSRYEGFGLTGLEAMAGGVPVVSTRRGALPEVYGDAAAYFECGDVEQLADAIESLWLDDARRGELIAGGLERARLFSWDSTARKTLKVYRMLCGS